MTKTDRLLKSFSAVEIRPEHRNSGDWTGFVLRRIGFAPSIATALIQYGGLHDLVAVFESDEGKDEHVYHWKQEFLADAVQMHLSIFGEQGRGDLPAKLLEIVQ